MSVLTRSGSSTSSQAERIASASASPATFSSASFDRFSAASPAARFFCFRFPAIP